MIKTRIMDRLFFLACNIHPSPPPASCLRLLDKIESDIIMTGINNGVGSNMANYDQWAMMYSRGESVGMGVEPSDKEFRSLLTTELHKIINDKELSTEDRVKINIDICRYYNQSESLVETDHAGFYDQSEKLVRYSTGFEPLDKIVYFKKEHIEDDTDGLVDNILLFLVSQPNQGKSRLALSIALNWDHGSVWFCDPEMGKLSALDMVRQTKRTSLRNDKEFFFGDYNIRDIIEMVKENPDPNRLIILESLSLICGKGVDIRSSMMYDEFCRGLSLLRRLCKLVIVTTHLVQNKDGRCINDIAGSATISRVANVIISINQDGILPNDSKKVVFYSTKNRHGPNGKELSFSFNYETCTYNYMIEDDY